MWGESMRERFMLAVFDGNKCIDKIRVSREDLDKEKGIGMEDYIVFISPKIAEFLMKHK